MSYSLYIDLMKQVLTDQIYRPEDGGAHGDSWPNTAHTMIGLKRLNNIQACVEYVVNNKIPGDLIETGVWRGGAVIFMRSLLKALNVTDRLVWVADSFEGVPPPNVEKYPLDFDSRLHEESSKSILSVSLDQVKTNFKSYDLLDDQVRFLKGLFKDTLPSAPIEKISVLRMDGDLYESTMDSLTNLYSKLSVGGFVIVDDYGVIPACNQAVNHFRKEHGITDEIILIDPPRGGGSAVYWQRTS